MPGIRLRRLDVGIQCESCELLCVRMTSAWSSCVAIVVYRTGPVTSAFFTELSGVLDRVSTFNDPILVVGNVNIRLTTRLPDSSPTLAAHGLTCHVTVATHDQVGLLDVATRYNPTLSPPATTCCCHLSKLSTLVFRNTGCCGGPRRLPSRLRSTRRGQVGRGVILVLTSSALH